MTPMEREAMLEWCEQDRPGQTEGMPMQNWRSIYGGAQKGRNMNGDSDEVHAASGYLLLANFVNRKMGLKTKANAWSAEIAEKRWTALKKQYRAACRIPEPHSTAFATDEELVAAKTEHSAMQEKTCPSFARIHAMLKEHPGCNPFNPQDSMIEHARNIEESDADIEEEEVLKPIDNHLKRPRKDVDASSVSGSKSSGSVKTKPIKSKEDEFKLRKPGNESAGRQRLNIHEMFLQTQMKQAEVEESKIMVSAVAELAKAGVKPADIPMYLEIMGLKAKRERLE